MQFESAKERCQDIDENGKHCPNTLKGAERSYCELHRDSGRKKTKARVQKEGKHVQAYRWKWRLLLKGCSKFCRLSIIGCGISSKAIVWPEKPGIIERQKHHVRNSLKMLGSLKWVVFGKDGPYARA
jgi:hypothetical protein